MIEFDTIGTHRFEKQRIALRYFLLGRNFTRAADALEFAGGYHVNMRKDGVTPEFTHQVQIAHYVRSLSPSLLYEEDTIIAALIHDVAEDYDVPHVTLRERFGERAAQAAFLMDKKSNANFMAIADDPVASIVKGSDRIHNLQTMVGVFTKEKMERYVAETVDHFIPMLKTARRQFPQQELAYENIKHMLLSQIELLSVVIDTMNTP